MLIGDGVVRFSFRLLRDVMDHNYVKKDSGERHVFEIMCANGDRRQLHFHKSGRMEEPTLLFNTTTPPPPINTRCSAAQLVERNPA